MAGLVAGEILTVTDTTKPFSLDLRLANDDTHVWLSRTT
jgi:hypothetical protein